MKDRERHTKIICLRNMEAGKKDLEEDTRHLQCRRPDANTIPRRSPLKVYRKHQTEYRQDALHLASLLLLLLHSSLSILSSSFISFFPLCYLSRATRPLYFSLPSRLIYCMFQNSYPSQPLLSLLLHLLPPLFSISAPIGVNVI